MENQPIELHKRRKTISRLVKDHWEFISLIVVILGGLATIKSVANVEYVDDKYNQAVKYVDSIRSDDRELLLKMDKKLDQIDARVWELSRRK